MRQSRTLTLEKLSEIRKIFPHNYLKLNQSDKSKIQLYHYTTVSALYEIIENKIIFATQSEFLNDITEVRNFDEILNKFINDIPENKKEFKKFCQNIEDFYHNDTWVNNKKYFILSLSTNKDNMMLWSYYAQNNGCNICFDMDIINNVISMDNNEYPYIAKIIYNKEVKLKKINKFMNIAFNDWKNITKRHLNFSINEISQAIFFDMAILLKNLALSCKKEAFIQEEEYRLVFTDIDSKKWLSNKDDLPKTIDYRANNNFMKKIYFREKNGNLIPYIKIRLKKHFFTQICIGPKNYSDIAELGWKEYFELNDYLGVTINISKIPLRY